MKKILVVDDAEYILDSTSTLLGFEGYEVITASDGFEGIEKAKTEQPDLIVCDISMPGMDGYEVLEKLREYDATRTTPFIFLTAFTDKTNMRAGMEKGADDYLFKPFTRDELIAAIEAQFRKSHIFTEHYQDRVDELSNNITNALPHEFRTLLNQIIGNANLINQNTEMLNIDDLKDMSSDILISAKRMLKIAENYLVYAQIESLATNRISIEQLKSYKTDEPGSLIRDLSDKIVIDFNRHNDLIFNDITSGVELVISSENFNKIMSELLDNAFRFSTKGTSVVVNCNNKNNYFCVSIEDKGRGMTKEQIRKVGAYMQFERNIYEQQGVGLGLSIAKKLVELHDGKFNIESIPQEGTKITIEFPMK